MVFNESLASGSMPMSCRRAVLTLLPKKGNPQDIGNWRPVSLLCVDYKLLSRVFASRLRGAMEQVLHRDQTYCVPGRSMVDNVHLIRDVLEVSSSLAVGGCSGADADRPPGPGLPAGSAFRPGGEEAPGAVEAEADRVGEEPPQRLQPAEDRAGPCRPLPRNLTQPGARGTHRPPAQDNPPRKLHTEQGRQEDFVF
ncbi:cuticle collagen 2-like [Pseudoliparis swirei]|uniref:cuticle collagen 2-like n=1 Tax=Pseudoliparis swirei TaxID=2059687 RepID=UPI0024BDB2AA|nr:cuticle collagen 2-like [Pseudoliparis swirei]